MRQRKFSICGATIKAMLALALSGRGRMAMAAEVKMSALVFTSYEYVTSKYLSDGTTSFGQNSFDVGRVYLNADAKFDDRVKGFVQYEANLITRDATTNSIYLKQALLEIKDIYPNARVLFGLIPVPWRAYEEGIWRHRFVAKTLEDAEGLLNATDRGVRLNGKAPLVEYDLAIINGEGTKNNETKASKYKDYTAKFALSPFAQDWLSGLKINLYLQEGAYGQNLPRDRIVGGLSYESKKFNLMGTSYNAKDKKIPNGDKVKGRGFSFHGSYNITDVCWAFARYDHWDPDTNRQEDARSRVFIGTGYRITEGVRMAIDYQALIRQKETLASKNESILASNFELKF